MNGKAGLDLSLSLSRFSTVVPGNMTTDVGFKSIDFAHRRISCHHQMSIV